MAKRSPAIDNPVMLPARTGSRLVMPDGVYRRIRNLYPTEEGGLRSIRSPLPLLIDILNGGPPPNGSANPGPLVTYGATRGIFHASLQEGAREVLLVHVDEEIWEFNGWSLQYEVLIGPTLSGARIQTSLPSQAFSDFPTQWVATPTGVVIIHQGGRAYFYDGVKIAQLGYDHAPGPPVGMGPRSSSDSWWPDRSMYRKGINDADYAFDGSVDGDFYTSMSPYLRYGRLGTVDTPGNVSVLAQSGEEESRAQLMGYLLPGRYRAVRQWIDCWGNISPQSPESNDIIFSRQPAQYFRQDGGGGIILRWASPDTVRKQVAWTGLTPGPEGTIGQIVSRTPDLENSGDPSYYVLPIDASVNASAFATVPDNISTMYADNIPDAWLRERPLDVAPIRNFRLAEMAFGRLFMANFEGDEGALEWSMVGRWGTVLVGSRLYPDPSAAKITGLKRVSGGLLVFTRRQAFLLTSSADGSSFVPSPIHGGSGCAAPSSIATMRNGMTVWLGDDGFYGYDGSSISYLFLEHRETAKRFNQARLHRAVAAFDRRSGEYRCWVPVAGSQENNICYTFDGQMWGERTDIAATGAVATDDHRNAVIVSGKVGEDDGVWVMDSAGPSVEQAIVETAWLRATAGYERASVRHVFLWLRETSYATSAADKILVEARADYRQAVVSSARVQPTPDKGEEEHIPGRWGVTALGSTRKWQRRRPFWVRVDLNLEAVEVFQLRISCTGSMELLGIATEEQPRPTSGNMVRS